MFHGRKPWLMPLSLAALWSMMALANGWIWSLKGKPGVGFIAGYESLEYGSGFLSSLLLALVITKLQKRLSPLPLILSSAALCYCGGILWRSTAFWTLTHAGLQKPFKPNIAFFFLRGGVLDGSTLALFSCLFFAFYYWRQAVEQKEKAQQATALAHQAQLQMLRYQLNPHFLFNALNSIRAMIIEDPERSRQMVTELADFLRYSLDGDEQESTIGDELQAIENYLAIQRIRFEEQLDATVHADPGALSVTVPCFLIHPLVENAVKYGMQTGRSPLRIAISVTLQGRSVDILVTNSGRLVEKPPHGDGTGTGLKNIAQRLNLVFPGRHSFKIWESDGTVHAAIRLELESVTCTHEVAQSTDRR